MKIVDFGEIVIKRFLVQSFILIPVFYFNILFVLFLLLGFEIESDYYDFSDLSKISTFLCLVINIIYFCFFYFMSNRYLPNEIRLRGVVDVRILALIAIYFVFSFFEHIGLERHIIKEEANIIRVILTAASFTYLSVALMLGRDWIKIIAVVILLVMAAASTFERESILYLAYPIFLRLSVRKWSFPILVLLGVAFILVIGGYKYMITESLLYGKSIFQVISSLDFRERVLRSMMMDNLHTSALQLFYFEGDAPRYHILSYLKPLQVMRLFDPDFMTNGQMATAYYTNGMTGTGFSAILEGWLNFWFLAPLMVPLILMLILRYIIKMQSAYLFIVFLVFLLKLQRGDLWPTFITIALGPIIFFTVSRIGAKMVQIFYSGIWRNKFRLHGH